MFHFYTLDIFIYLQEEPFFLYDRHLLRIEIFSVTLSCYVYKNGIAQVGGFFMEALEALSASEVAPSWFIWPPSPRWSGFLCPTVRRFQVHSVQSVKDPPSHHPHHLALLLTPRSPFVHHAGKKGEGLGVPGIYRHELHEPASQITAILTPSPGYITMDGNTWRGDDLFDSL